jgi:hypothetical protein
LDPTLIDLEVCNFTFIHLKMPTKSAYNPGMVDQEQDVVKFVEENEM